MTDYGHEGTPKDPQEIKDLPQTDKDLGATDAENVKGGRMRAEPEVTKNDTTDMYK